MQFTVKKVLFIRFFCRLICVNVGIFVFYKKNVNDWKKLFKHKELKLRNDFSCLTRCIFALLKD